MEQVTLTVKKREKAGTRVCKILRNEGYVPAVLYGHGEENVSLALPQKELENHLRHNVRIMKLKFGKGFEQAMIKELQWDGLGDQLVHVDLLRIRMDEVVSMSVPIESKGRAMGIDEGGILETHRTDIQIRCMPANIPDVLTYDVTGLGINDSLHVKEIPLPEEIELDDDPDQVVVTISSRVEAAEEEAEAPGEGEEAAAGAEGGPEGGGEEEHKKD